MGMDDKIKNQATEAKGKVKEAAGSASGDDDLKAQGKADQDEAKLKDAGRHLKEGAEKVKDAFKN